jgi:hypothetical protein
MKLTIKGEVNLPVLGEAMTRALEYVQFDPKRLSIRGATLYFNFYSRETGEMVTIVQDGKEVDSLAWETPVEKERKRQQALSRQKKGKAKRVMLDGRPDQPKGETA